MEFKSLTFLLVGLALVHVCAGSPIEKRQLSGAASTGIGLGNTLAGAKNLGQGLMGSGLGLGQTLGGVAQLAVDPGAGLNNIVGGVGNVAGGLTDTVGGLVGTLGGLTGTLSGVAQQGSEGLKGAANIVHGLLGR